MKHYSLLQTSVFLLLGCFLLNSCSTSNQASRFSHLKYVKKDHAGIALDNHSPMKEEISPLKNDQAVDNLPTPENDYSASVQEMPSSKMRKTYEYISKASASELAKSFSDIKNDKIEVLKNNKVLSLVKDKKINILKKSNSADLMHDQDKLLLLWLVLLGGAILFSLLAYYVAGAFGIVAVLAGIACTIFFILWIVAIATS